MKEEMSYFSEVSYILIPINSSDIGYNRFSGENLILWRLGDNKDGVQSWWTGDDWVRMLQLAVL